MVAYESRDRKLGQIGSQNHDQRRRGDSFMGCTRRRLDHARLGLSRSSSSNRLKRRVPCVGSSCICSEGSPRTSDPEPVWRDK
jgi:hypothetical protein